MIPIELEWTSGSWETSEESFLKVWMTINLAHIKKKEQNLGESVTASVS